MDKRPMLLLNGFGMGSSKKTITPQPEPTSPRIKLLLGRALMTPETLNPQEVQEMAASIVYHLILENKA